MRLPAPYLRGPQLPALDRFRNRNIRVRLPPLVARTAWISWVGGLLLLK